MTTSASQQLHEAFEDELALLDSMYPDVIQYDRKASQLDFVFNKSTLSLRIPSDYPATSLPETLSATGPRKRDLRDNVQELTRQQEKGEPCLDAIIEGFMAMLDEPDASTVRLEDEDTGFPTTNGTKEDKEKTVIVYLHHLLALSKRKIALNPSVQASAISGITKPGYPGVLVFSGLVDAVEAHVRELKGLNWQAFQVRMEDEEAWGFKHGAGIIEVETMAEVVSEVGKGRKKDFLAAMKMAG